MILLKATTETIQIVTSSSANLDYSISFTDNVSGVAGFSSSEGAISSATTTTVVSAPAASSSRVIKLLTITNRDALVSVAISVVKDISGTTHTLYRAPALLAGEMLQYMDAVGWRYYAAGGALKGDQTAALSSISTEVQYNSSDVLGPLGAAPVWTQRDSAGSRAWRAVASSADGMKLLAVDDSPGYVYTSTDSGATWTVSTSGGSGPWVMAASSADGTKLVIGLYGGELSTSTDSGATWTVRTSSGTGAWLGVASSADGTKLAAVIYFGSLKTSTDSGVSWTTQTAPGTKSWSCIACSDDGTKLVAAAYGDFIYTSTDSGVNWTQRTTSGMRNWSGLASSADGTKLVAADSTPGYIYTSTDSGATWTQQTAAGSRAWNGVASTVNGAKILAGANPGFLYNFGPVLGLTWDGSLNELGFNGPDTSILMQGVTIEPAAPVAGSTRIYTKAIVGKMQLKIKGPSGLDTPLQAALWQNNSVWWTPSITTGAWTGTSGVPFITGTNALALPTTTNLYTMMRRSTFANSATTTNQTMGLRTELMFTRGNTAGIGGFMFVCRFGFSSIKTGMRAFVGFGVNTTGMVAADPSSRLNIVGFGFDLADTAWTFMHNDGTGTATKETIPGQGTLATNNTAYDAYIWCAPNSSTVNYRLDRVDTGVTLVDSSTSTDLPVDTTILTAQCVMSNGTANVVAGDAVLGVNRLYVETDR